MTMSGSMTMCQKRMHGLMMRKLTKNQELKKDATRLANSFTSSRNRCKRKRQIKEMERILSNPSKRDQLIQEMAIRSTPLRPMTRPRITSDGGDEPSKM